MIQRARKREKRSKVQKGPKRNRGVKKDGGRLNFENKGHKIFLGIIKRHQRLGEEDRTQEEEEKGSRARKEAPEEGES